MIFILIIRRYSELEDLLCLGCSPNEMSNIDNNKRTIKICLSFVYKLWGQNETNIVSK
jgi:hypothetical protein